MFSWSRACRAAAPTLEDVTAAFRVLGMQFNPQRPVTENPSGEAVRKQYRQLAQLHHPDLSSGSDKQMSVINTAYELIQSSGVLQNTFQPALDAYRRAHGSTPAQAAGGSESRYQRKAGSRRRRVPDDFASGDDASWSMKSTLEWQTMIQSADNITEQEMRNPANHPFSHSKFFSFEDDAAIYRMIRGGATVKQVGRTLGKPATFVERRLQNAQFKQRIQYLLREEKRRDTASARNHIHHVRDGSGGSSASSSRTRGSSVAHHATDNDSGEETKVAAPVAPNMHQKALRHSPFDGPQWSNATAAAASARAAPPPQFRRPRVSSPGVRKREWEPSYPEWKAPEYFDNLSLEEKGQRDGILPNHEHEKTAAWVNRERPAASKVGRSYAHYSRLHGQSSRRPSQ